MNLKAIWGLLSISLLAVPLATSTTLGVAGYTTTPYSVVKILFPNNATYDSRFLTLNATFTAGPLHYTLTYKIDGKEGGAIPFWAETPHEVHSIGKAIGSVALPELPDGSHRITVTIVCGLYGYLGANPPGAPFKPTSPGSTSYEATWTDTVYFTIASGASATEPAPAVDTVPPKISDVSLRGRTYTSTEVPLNFTVSESVSLVTYSLDGNNNVTIAGNATLTGLSVGLHNVTVYARDAVGKTGASETVTFTVADENEPFPAVLVAVALAATAVVGAGLTVYSKKRNQQRVPASATTAR